MRKAQAYYFFVGFCIFCLYQFTFCQTQPSPTTAQPDEISLIHFGDLIDVDVVGSFEFDWRGTINPEGYLAGFDKITEPVRGLCRSEDDLAASVAKEYGKFLRDPRVVVKVLDRSNRPVAILEGAVKTPQRFQIKRAVFLNELLILSGGLTDRASGEITVFRPQNLNCLKETEEAIEAANGGSESHEKFIAASRGNGSETLDIRLVDLLGGNRLANPQILSGDIITVGEAAPIYLIGGVNNPKQIASRSQMSLTRAIASAGGLAKEGMDKVTIFRRTHGAGRQAIEADLKKIKDGIDPDPVLEPFDIVDVSQKGKEKRKVAPEIETSDPGAEGRTGLPLRVVD